MGDHERRSVDSEHVSRSVNPEIAVVVAVQVVASTEDVLNRIATGVWDCGAYAEALQEPGTTLVCPSPNVEIRVATQQTRGSRALSNTREPATGHE